MSRSGGPKALFKKPCANGSEAHEHHIWNDEESRRNDFEWFCQAGHVNWRQQQLVVKATVPTKQREGDQVLPSGDTSVTSDQRYLIDLIDKREQVGIERYGQGHRPFNGRNTFLDFFEEHLDGLVYLTSILRATEADRDQLVEEITKAIEAHDLQRDVLKDTSMLWNRQDAEHQAKYVVARIYGWLAGQRMAE